MLEQRSSYQKNLFSLWPERIITHPMIEAVMNATGVIIPTDIVPPSFQLTQIAKEEVSRLLSCILTHAEHKRRTAIELVVNVVKAGKLSSNEHGDITLLSDAVSCGKRFAKKVLNVINDGVVEELYNRNTRCDSIVTSDWPSVLENFVLRPENSHAVPGREQISVRYGQQHAK